MISLRFRELITTGYALANKLYFKEFNPHEFNRWVEDCERLLSNCDPEPYFPLIPGPRHIEEIVLLLQETLFRISLGKVQYIGLFQVFP